MKSTEERLSEGLEMARCAQANLENLATAIQLINKHPYFKIVELQIQQTIDALEGKEE